ncbi:MAG: Glu-tRNA(Gln) amidotransferase subunit GatD [Candidatus Aenigmarchaeota archaeon]|nr:Glu-tRNA(Gln) amidotransferase subunit GatD [Candidatus Aenigmarchaeota archaeon]
MYSGRLGELLEARKLDIGDFVRIKFKGAEKSGIIMPKDQFSRPEVLYIKLANGYNIGILADEIKGIEKCSETDSGPQIRPRKISFDKTKPKISAVITGGTIASKVDYRTGGVTGLSKSGEILENIPELSDIVNMECISPFTKMSEDLGHEDWIEIAKAVAKQLNNGDRGVIVTHGTDFLHYTSAALSFMLRNLTKPVALVGSQRSSDRGSSDAGMNLICAAHIATGDIAEVGVCMHGSTNDDFCFFSRGTKVRKMHTSRRDAFRPINELPLAKVWTDGKIEKINPVQKKRSDGDVELDIAFEPKVAILKAYPDADPDVIDYYIGKGYRGFVIETAGLGHVPTFAKKSWIETIRKHTKDGIPFIGTAQTIYGRIDPSVYTNLRMLYHDAGAICSSDMLTETAYVKLGWVLGHTEDIEEVRKMMLTNIAGEITQRTLPETYLY